jgi:hypothetical protein
MEIGDDLNHARLNHVIGDINAEFKEYDRQWKHQRFSV